MTGTSNFDDNRIVYEVLNHPVLTQASATSGRRQRNRINMMKLNEMFFPMWDDCFLSQVCLAAGSIAVAAESKNLHVSSQLSNIIQRYSRMTSLSEDFFAFIANIKHPPRLALS